MEDNEYFPKYSTSQREKYATRRRFSKSAIGADAVAALYAVPKFVTAHAKKTVAAISGPLESATISPEETVITFEEAAGVELAPGWGQGAHWQESGYDVKAVGHYQRAFDDGSWSLNINPGDPNSDGIEITSITGGTFSISSVDTTFDIDGAVISSNKGGSTNLNPGTHSLAGSNWSDVSKVTIVTYNHPSSPVWIDNILVSKP